MAFENGRVTRVSFPIGFSNADIMIDAQMLSSPQEERIWNYVQIHLITNTKFIGYTEKCYSISASNESIKISQIHSEFDKV